KAGALGSSTGSYKLIIVIDTAKQTETEPNDSFVTANPLAIGTTTPGNLGANDVDYFQFTLFEGSSRFTAQVQATGFAVRLSLYDENGSLLIQSNGQSSATSDALIAQHLEGSESGKNYYLKVESRDGGVGTYLLSN